MDAFGTARKNANTHIHENMARNSWHKDLPEGDNARKDELENETIRNGSSDPDRRLKHSTDVQNEDCGASPIAGLATESVQGCEVLSIVGTEVEPSSSVLMETRAPDADVKDASSSTYAAGRGYKTAYPATKIGSTDCSNLYDSNLHMIQRADKGPTKQLLATREKPVVPTNEQQYSDEACLRHAVQDDGEDMTQIRRLDKLMPFSRTIHILGSGPMGQYVAHSLSRLPNAPHVSLFLHKPLLVQQWQDEGQAIRLVKDGHVDINCNVHIEPSYTPQHWDPMGTAHSVAKSENGVINHLIVTTEGGATIPALRAIKHRLRAFSTVCIISDGMGIVDEVNSTLFPSPLTRPNYVLGSMSHNVRASPDWNFAVIENLVGKLSLTSLERQKVDANPEIGGPAISIMDNGWSSTSNTSHYLMRVLTRVPDFDATGFTNLEYMRSQLEKLAVTAVIGPLSVVFDCLNDELLYNYHVTRTMRPLITEISKIIRNLPEVKRMPRAEYKFSVDRIQAIVFSVLIRTGRRHSQMLNQVQNGERTDVDHFNGYLIRRALELDIPCPLNEMLLFAVKGKQAIMNRTMQNRIPFAY